MTRPRATIAQLMAAVLYVAFGIAALRNADGFWASATFTVAVVTLSIALVAACTRSGRARASAAGFAFCGWACLVIWLATPNTVGYMDGPPRMLVYWGAFKLQASINPMASGGAPLIAYSQISHSLEVILVGFIGAVVGHFVAAPRNPSPAGSAGD
jgi:hypothetical protein